MSLITQILILVYLISFIVMKNTLSRGNRGGAGPEGWPRGWDTAPQSELPTSPKGKLLPSLRNKAFNTPERKQRSWKLPAASFQDVTLLIPIEDLGYHFPQAAPHFPANLGGASTSASPYSRSNHRRASSSQVSNTHKDQSTTPQPPRTHFSIWLHSW